MARLSAQLAAARTRVGSGALRRHAVRRLGGGDTFLLASARGFPRLWQYTLDGVFDGFARGLAAPCGGEASARLLNALQSAREALAARGDALVERRAPDASAQCVCVDGPTLHVLSAGAGRIYWQRGDARPTRLSPREPSDEALLRATPTWASRELAPGDLIMAGSLSAFSEQAVSRVSALLRRDPLAAPKAIANLLLEPTRTSGVGGVALVARVPPSLT